MPISETIRNRILEKNGKFFCNDNISQYIKDDELNLLIEEVSVKFEEVLKSLIIDTANDHNTKDSAKRIAKMYILETMSGRYTPMPKITAFPNVSSYDQLYVTGPITVRSLCSHHFQNISGKCYVGVFPGKNVIGLSKFTRMVNWISSRPQIQEECTSQIADIVEKETQADGVAVLIQARHDCMLMRGVKESYSVMSTSVLRGKFRDDTSLKQEFFNMISKMP